MLKFFLLLFCLYLTACTANTNPEAANINSNLGLAYLKEHDVLRAKEKLLLAQTQDPHSAEVLGALAYFYNVTGHLNTANHYYIQALSYAPNHADSLNNYAVFLCKQKQYSLAIAYFLKAANLESNLNPAETYENAGLCALKIPDHAQANHYFQLALQNNPAPV